MTEYLIISYIPSRQGWAGPIPEKYTVDKVHSENISELYDRLHIPINGKVYVVSMEHVTILRSKIVNEIVTK